MFDNCVEVKGHGETLLGFCNETKMCGVNGRFNPDNENFSSISTKGSAVVDFFGQITEIYEILKILKLLQYLMLLICRACSCVVWQLYQLKYRTIQCWLLTFLLVILMFYAA